MVKHGGGSGSMPWGYFSSAETGTVVKIEVIVDNAKYQSFLV